MRSLTELLAAAQAELSHVLASVDENAVAALRAAILDANRVFITGKGRSGLQMRGLAMRLMHMGLLVHVVDDVTTPGIGAGDLLIIGSGSGRTPSLVHYAQRAKQERATVALITIAETSPLGEYADVCIRLAASTPKLADARPSLLPLGSSFELALGILLDVIVIQLMDERHTTSDEMFTRHANLE
jgi:6-phospho-3-hexuloisomerase